MSQKFALLVPIKALTHAKSRLRSPVVERRAELMRAFAQDALAAAVRSDAVGQVYVVTDEPGFDVDGILRLPDEGDGDLNRALVHAAVRARLEAPTNGVAAICADLPSLVHTELTAGLSSGLSPRWFVADTAGSGTTLLAAGPGVDLDPHFGPESSRRHEESGAVPVRADLPTLRRDVDTDDDLIEAIALGVGPHTRAVLPPEPLP
jgi:2-phospho-L-lactate/phosphoenolpyruvate guanylyltransferase